MRELTGASYEAFGKANIDMLLERFSGSDLCTGWEMKKAVDGIEFFVGNTKDSPLQTLKATARIQAPRHLVRNTLVDPAAVVKIDDMMTALNVLETVSSSVSVRHATSKGFPPVSPRDFVLLTAVDEVSEGLTVIASRSIDHPADPRPSGFVRATALILGYVLADVPGEDDATEVSLILHFDMGGYIPHFALQLAGVQGPKMLMKNAKKVIEGAFDRQKGQLAGIAGEVEEENENQRAQ